MKSVIIDRLIEIEESARDITKNADESEEKLPALIHKEEDEIEQRLMLDYEKKSAEIKKEKEHECETRLAEIERDAKLRTKKLEELYEQNHKEWEDEIFSAIIGR